MTRKTRKDKGVRKPKAAADEIITPAEFKKLDRKEKERRLTNLANTLNRRLGRLEKHGMSETEAAREITTRAKKAGATKTGRIAKDWKKKTEEELQTIYTLIAPLKNVKETLVRTAKKILKDIGAIRKKEVPVEEESERTWEDLSKKEKQEFWEAFEKLKARFKPEVERDSHYYKWLSDEFKTYTQAQDAWKNPGKIISGFIKGELPEGLSRYEEKAKQREEEFEDMLKMEGLIINPDDLPF